ncbi:hypothetical protein DV736_g600, partial [Chaetothyriales sp. CBS 134916]
MSGNGSGSATAHPPEWAPWRQLLEWSPFNIDALGLVTLLGADEINAAVGRLVRSRWLEYLPFLGAYVVAGNNFREKEPGYNLYNITRGIHTTDLSPWFSRWIKSQNFTSTRSFVRWTVVPPRHRPLDVMIAVTISLCLVGFLLALAILQYDMYGVGSTAAIAWSIVVRWVMISSVRKAIDQRVSEMCDPKDEKQQVLGPVIDESETYEGKMRKWKDEMNSEKLRGADGLDFDQESGTVVLPEEPHRLSCGWSGVQLTKVVVITTEALPVTMIIPSDLMGSRSVFNADLPPRHRFLYGIARWTGWLAFVIQVVTIGQAVLVTQIYSVCLLVIPTILYVAKFGCDDSNWLHNIEQARNKLGTHLVSPKKHLVSRASQEKALKEFILVSRSQIGTRLVAEVYEWPLNHDFIPVNGGFRLRSTQDVSKGERLARRQWLYAWLQLTDQEHESLDKWDLFPHGRDDTNKTWYDDYRKMKDAISKLSSPIGSIRGLMGAADGGFQDFIARHQAAEQETSSSLSSSTHISTVSRNQAQNGAAFHTNGRSSPRVFQDTSAVSATQAVGVGEESQNTTEVGASLAGSMNLAVNGLSPENASVNVRHRRHSVHTGVYQLPFDDGPLGSAFMATNLMRQERYAYTP